MADPLRRTLLAKLRGNKSKKGTPAGGYGVAANGGREGKEKVSQNPDGQAHPVVMLAELHCVADNIMRGNESYVNGNVENIGSVWEQSTVGVVKTSVFPQQYEAPATMHINTSRGPGDNQGSGGSGFRGRVNEELLGVSLQIATQYGVHDRYEMDRIHKQVPCYFSRQVQQEHIGRPHEQRKQFGSIPRQYSAGDSIGFGGSSPNNNIIYHRRPGVVDREVVKLTGGHYPASKSNGTNVCFDKYLKTRVSDGQADSCHQTVYNYKAENAQRSINYLKGKAKLHPGHNQILETNVTTNLMQMYPLGVLCAQHPTGSYTEENIVIRNIESYGSSPEFTGDNIRVTHLHSPTFFPTELEICDVNVASNSICAREGTLRHHSIDSEDDDYYDNEILPFYISESVGPNDRKGSDKVESIESGIDVPKGHVISDSVQETDRLHSQLKEAYYLLINAMHDISFDGQVNVNGFIDQKSMCSWSSSFKRVGSDAWSSGEYSAQQVSDMDSLLLCQLSENNNLISKSLVNLSASRIRPPLLHSTSDGTIKYSSGVHNGPCIQGLGSQSPSVVGACEDGDGASRPKAVVASDPFEKQTSYDGGTSSDDLLQDTGDYDKLNESRGSVNSLTGSSDNAEPQQGGNNNPDREMSGWALDQGGSAKPHGVTVNKMQEWMHKGRLLSSEMKQRIAGSTPQPHGAHGGLDRAPRPSQDQVSSGPRGSKPEALTTRVDRAKPAAVVSCQGQATLKSALIENDNSSFSNGLDVGGGKAVETLLWRPPLNTITVSKKRNWLQQSSGRPHHATDDPQYLLGAEEYNGHGQAPPPPLSPSPENLNPPGPTLSHPLRLVSVGPARVAPRSRYVDPTEENDADDEGEIWYNPIPEDEEPELHHNHRPTPTPQVRLMVHTRPKDPHVPQTQRRPSRGEEAGVRRVLEGCSPNLEGVGESLGGGGGERSQQGIAIHCMGPSLHLHRQMLLACKPQKDLPSSSSRATATAEATDLAIPGFSPPSSPNPAKRGSSLNWSFPDKIKSPRTVRKLSMKMKKLPELSRKLSIKGTPSNNNNSSCNGASASIHSETRTQCPKTNYGSEPGPAPPRLSPRGGQGAAASHNVISRYHLDSSVSTQQSYSKKKSSGTSKSASKGGYLSDGDSPELVAKSGKHGSSEAKGGNGKEKDPATGGGEKTGAGGVTRGSGSPKLHGTELDIDAFRHYAFTEQPKCTQYISGLMSLHFYGAEDLKPPRFDSRDVYCAIQVDSVNKARTALLTCRTTFLDMDHTFNIELENAQRLKLVVFSWDPTPKKNRVCCYGTVVLPALFRVTRSHQLAVKLEPRGLIYVKLTLMEQWQNSLDGGYNGDREPQMFGVEAWRVVVRENTGLMLPLLIEKCITEIETRGCQVVGLYRLCGSAAVKKELREAFERDSLGVELCENTYPDINVITGVLKDYLRELPYPLITKHLYETVLDSMAKRPLRIGAGGCENDPADTEHTVSLLENLPEVERLTLRRLLDHLKLVASHHEVNKMTCQNLAVCFGPVLLSQRQEASCHSNRVFIDSEELASALHFKKHIEVLHYLLQLWPVVDPHDKTSSTIPELPGPADQPASPPLRRRKERPQMLNLSDAEMAGVLRPRPGRLDSPSNRYAGDWSRCGESYFPPPRSREENDYADVPSEDMEVTEEEQEAVEDRGQEGGEEQRQEWLLDRGQEEGQAEPATAEQEPPLLEEVMEGPVEVEKEERDKEEEREAERRVEESDGSSGGQPSDDRVCDDDDQRILPLHLPKEHTYQAYMKIQDISPVLSNKVNLRDLQESIDTLIGNLERELNKNKLNVGY